MPVGPYFADFLCRQARLIVELDGHSHDIRPERDLHRDEHLISKGFRVMHFTNSDVLGNAEGVIAQIRLALAQGPTPDLSRIREEGL